MNLIGNFTALVTPFKKNEQIDFPSLENLCKNQINNFSDGIVALGSTAEATALDQYEKHKVMETITKVINNKLPIIAGVNAFTLNDAIYQCDARFLDGADALLISPPPYIKPTQNGIFNYYTKIADHSFIPIILYNIPSRTGTNINYETIIKLAKHPNIIGLKDACGDISFTQNVINNTSETNFSVLSGNDNNLLPILSLGGTGIISVFGNINPKLMHDITYLYQNKNTIEARELYFNNLNFINSMSLESNPICVKYTLYKLGLIQNILRKPLTKISQKNAKIINQLLKNNHFTNTWNRIFVN